MAPYPNQSERGAALLVAMVMLFMMTILGISAMQSANVETQLAGNAIVKETTFQSAESATQAVLDSPNVLSDLICQPDPVTISMTNLNRAANQTTEVSVQYGGLGLAAGFSIDSQMAQHRFYITGRSSVEDMGTSTTIAIGHIHRATQLNGTGC